MQYLNRKTLIIIGIVAAVGTICGVLFIAKDYLWPSPQEVAEGEPIDITLDFYEPWLAAAQSTSTDPYKEGLTKYPVLSKELRQKIAKAKGRTDTEPDPVLCQTVPPLQISARLISQIEGAAQVLVLSRVENQDGQAVVHLTRLNEGWYISDIVCSPGEFGPEREFSFDTEGFLLKSVPAPLDPEYWHLVFEERGEPGHVVPLFFGAESICIARNGSEGACDPSVFVEPMRAHVRGEMMETGVNVKRLNLLPE